MGVPKKHHTKSKVRRRRSGHHMKAAKPTLCQNCKAPTLPHRVCGNCGAYGTRVAVTAVSREEEEE